MGDRTHLLILANSFRAGKRCVAGKITAPSPAGCLDVGAEWIRLSDPRARDGTIPQEDVLRQGCGAVRPLDIVSVALDEPCNNPNHPEDWCLDPAAPWDVAGRVDKACLPQILDGSEMLWHDDTASGSVHAGFVSQMAEPTSVRLIRAPPNSDFCFWKKPLTEGIHPGQTKFRLILELSFSHADRHHEFFVTDPEFLERHNIWNRMTESPQHIRLPDSPNVFLCLSLDTELHGRHPKICDTIFEP